MIHTYGLVKRDEWMKIGDWRRDTGEADMFAWLTKYTPLCGVKLVLLCRTKFAHFVCEIGCN